LDRLNHDFGWSRRTGGVPSLCGPFPVTESRGFPMQLLFRFRLLCVPFLTLLTLIPAPADDKDDEKGWLQLFNGKDLTGWVTHENPNPGAYSKVEAKKNDDGKIIAYVGIKDDKEIPLWTVKDGTLVGSGPHSHLFTAKDDYTDFHYRVEAKINDKGNSGQYFRAELGPGFPKGYEAQINATGGDPIKTGSLYPDGRTKLGMFKKDITVMNDAPNKPDEWFTQEVIAKGNHIQIIVNGKKTVDFMDPNNTYMKGRFALQGHDPGTVVTFRKVEWKPLKKLDCQ
jgi:hypothetical protein